MLNDVSTGIGAGIGCALAIALCLVGSCQPAPASRTPLGSGELAQAEAARIQRLQAKLAQQRRLERWGQLKNTPAPTASAVAEVDDAKSKESDEDKKASAKDSADGGLARVDDAGADAGDAGAVADFAGEYHGSDTMTLELPGMPPQAQTDPKAILRVEQGDSELTIIIVDSSKGSDMCSILADALGKRATIRPDQRCFEEATSGMNGTVEQGTVELDGDKIRVAFEGEIEIVAARLTAPASYSFEGKRNK